MKNFFVLLLMIVSCCAKGYAQAPSDSVRIYYRQGHRDVDPSFGDNRTELDRFLLSIRRACELGQVNRLVIRSYASPDGVDRLNERLSRLRADSMESYVLRHTDIPASMIEKNAEGVAWGLLREMVASSNEVPYRDEVLDILDHTPLWIFDDRDRVVDGRKKRLMSLRGGTSYNYLLEHFFPILRSSAAASLYTKDYGKAARTASDEARSAAEAAAVAAAAATKSAETAETAASMSNRIADALETSAETVDSATAMQTVRTAVQAASEARAAADTATTAATRTRAAAAAAAKAATEALEAAKEAATAEKRSDSEDASKAAQEAETAAATAARAEEAAQKAEEAAHIAAKTAEAAAARVRAAETAMRDAQAAAKPTDPATAPQPLHRIALKTNLLYDVLLMPSLEAEYRIDDRWSVAAEGDVAWWKNEKKHKYYQIAAITAEGRYWFRTRKPWHGHYVGVFTGGSWYDLENGKTGYRGEALLAGISYGYMWPVSRCLSLETGVGVGYAYTKYEEYRPQDGHYLYQQTNRTNYFGPLKLKFALVWRLWDENKGKGGVR